MDNPKFSSISQPSSLDSEASSEERSSGVFPFGHYTRFVILGLACLCLSATLSNILTLNFTIICMQGPPKKEVELNSSTEIQRIASAEMFSYQGILLHIILLGDEVPDQEAKYTYTQQEKNALFSSVAVGALIAVFPIMMSLHRLGPRLLFSLIGLLSALSTAFIPLAAEYGIWCLLVCRLLQGAGLAVCLPVIGSITSHWSTLTQNAFFIAILSSFLQVAPMFTMPVSGQLCVSSLGWQSVFYLHSAISFILFTIFIFVYRDAPRKHRLVTAKELSRIHDGKEDVQGSHTPYGAIVATPQIWVIWIAAFGNFLATQLTLQYTPIYLNKVLSLPVESTGTVCAIPPFIMFFVKLFAGLTSDNVKFVTEKNKLRLYNSIALGGMAIFFILLAIVPTKETILCIACLIAASVCLGFNSGGFFKSAQLVARHHSHFVMGIISAINCLCMLIVPSIVQLIAPNNAPEEWSIIFYLHAGVLLVTNACYFVLPGYQAAPWASRRLKSTIMPKQEDVKVVHVDNKV